MATKNDENWMAKYLELKAHVIRYGHLTERHNRLNHWWKYQKKKRKAGTLSEEQVQMLEELSRMRTHEHTGGRKSQDKQTY